MNTTRQESAVIYLSDQRKEVLNKDHIKKEILGNDQLGLPERYAFLNLIALNEVNINACKEMETAITQKTLVVLLPIHGELVYKALTDVTTIDVGELVVFSLEEGQIYNVFNPYKENSIQYLELHFYNSNVQDNHISFDLQASTNNLIELMNTVDIKLSLGMFEGRSEGAISIRNATRGVFSYVLQGAFEFQNRLLQVGDSLALWDLPTQELIEFEALSNGAIILTIEFV